jgi:hypothetical protein
VPTEPLCSSGSCAALLPTCHLHVFNLVIFFPLEVLCFAFAATFAFISAAAAFAAEQALGRIKYKY